MIIDSFRKDKQTINSSSSTMDEKFDFSVLDGLRISLEQQLHLINIFHEAMRTGLLLDTHKHPSPHLIDGKLGLPMLPTFVTRLPTGQEHSQCILTLDMGGTNVRVGHVCFLGHGKWTLQRDKWPLPPDLLQDENVPGKLIWQHLAERVYQHLIRGPSDASCSTGACSTLYAKGDADDKPLGFTFSYPIKQEGLAHGCLLQWNKAVRGAKNAIGTDVVANVQAALDHEQEKSGNGGGRVVIKALLNDTVGTYLAHAYADPLRTKLAVVLGTGTNAAYWQPPYNTMADSQITDGCPNDEPPLFCGDGMLINTEWGAMALPDTFCTRWDHAIDAATANPGKQLFEKAVSGMYLPLIVNEILRDEQLGSIGDNFVSSAKDLSHLESAYEDNALGEDEVKRAVVAQVARAVSDRSVAFVAAAICAALSFTNQSNQPTTGSVKEDGENENRVAVVAIDGALFQQYHTYASRLQASVDTVWSAYHRSSKRSCIFEKVVCVESMDQSSVGAAVAVILAQQQHTDQNNALE